MSGDRACSSRSSLQPFLQKKENWPDILSSLAHDFGTVILACHSLVSSRRVSFRPEEERDPETEAVPLYIPMCNRN